LAVVTGMKKLRMTTHNRQKSKAKKRFKLSRVHTLHTFSLKQGDYYGI